MVNPLGFFTHDGKHKPIFARKPKSRLPPSSKKQVTPKHGSIYTERMANIARLSTSFAFDKARQFQENKKLGQQLDLQKKMHDEKNMTKSKEEVEQEQRHEIENRKPLNSEYDIFRGGGIFKGNERQEMPVRTEEQEHASAKEKREQEKFEAIRYKLLQSSGGRERLGVVPQH